MGIHQEMCPESSYWVECNAQESALYMLLWGIGHIQMYTVWPTCLLLCFLPTKTTSEIQHLSHTWAMEGLFWMWTVMFLLFLSIFWSVLVCYYTTMQDGTYVPVTVDNRCINIHPDHSCSTKWEVSICCVDENGKIWRTKVVQKILHIVM